ncbi:MAG TPA: DinB family protein [Herpetosiphonaceae bacterium]
MDLREQKYLIVDDRLSAEPEIGRWLWAFQDARRRTLSNLDGLTQATIDWLPPNDESSISTVLYHMALIEADWLYTEVLEQPYPAEVVALFPYPDREAQGHLTQVAEISLDQHLERLATVRNLVLDVFQQMSLAEFRRVRSLPAYDVTPEWVLHHLMQHEAEHRSQIGALRAAAERALGQ